MNKALHIKEEWRGRFLHGTNPKSLHLCICPTQKYKQLYHTPASRHQAYCSSLSLIRVLERDTERERKASLRLKELLEWQSSVWDSLWGASFTNDAVWCILIRGKAVYPTPKRKRGLSNGPPSPLLTSAQRQQQHSLRLSLAPLFLLSSAFEVKNLPWRIQLFSALYLHVEMIRSLSKCKTIAIGCSCLCMSQKSSKACKGCAKTSDKQVKFLFKKC